MQTDRARRILFLIVLALFAPHRAAVAAEYFVNDLSTEGDVYCTAPGRAGGYGTSPGDPQLSLEAVFRVYDLLPGDVVYVDTGVFANSVNVLVGAAGQEGSPVTILGSTNRAAGGTVLAAPETGAGQPVLVLDRASHLHLHDIDVRGGAPGVVIRDSSACLLERCSAAEAQSSGISMTESSDITLDNVQAYGNAGHGVGISGSTFRIVDGLFVQNAGRGVSASPSGESWLESSTIADNADTQVYISSSQPVHLRNCILVSSADHVACLYTSDPVFIDADYNDYWTIGLARIARHGNDIYMTIEDWRAASGGDAHSLSHDPFFGDPDGLDYHLQSTAGRFVAADSWTSDGQQSPCIDAGDPAAPFDEEPAPNGSRANMGAYAQGPEASKSSPEARLLVVTLNNGGKASGSVELEWRAFNVEPGATVTVQYALGPDAPSWETAATGLPAEPGVYAWDTTSVGTGSPLASWRVVLDADPSVVDATDRTFALHPFVLYVNDGEASGDVYCTQPAGPFGNGIGPGSPAPDLQSVIDAYDLEPDDTIYVDTGFYSSDVNTVIPEEDSGSADAPLRILGSPNLAGGGSHLHLTTSGDSTRCLHANKAHHLEIEDLRLSGGQIGLALFRSTSSIVRRIHASDCGTAVQIGSTSSATLEDIDTENSMTGLRVHSCGDARVNRLRAVSCSFAGVHVSDSHRAELRNVIACDNGERGVYVEYGSDTRLRQITSAGNGEAAVWVRGPVTVANSILHAAGAGRYAVMIGEGFLGDYEGQFNDLCAADGASPGCVDEAAVADLAAWRTITGWDITSLSEDPLFADPANGDYHLQSLAGRYAGPSSWVIDAVHSPCIDRGNPDADASLEPSPNGGQLNLGAYGNTPEASLSTGSEPPYLIAVSPSGPGSFDGQLRLNWSWGRLPRETRVDLEYSTDAGVSWATIAADREVGEGTYLWYTTDAPSSPVMLWRVRLSSDPTVSDACEKTFMTRNGAVFDFYVNDASTQDDVFCAAPGMPGADGATPASPSDSLQAIFDMHDLEPGDTVFCDNGIYELANGFTADPADSGAAGQSVTVRGVPGSDGTQTVFRWSDAPDNTSTFRLGNLVGLRFRDLTVEDGYEGIFLFTSTDCSFSNVTVRLMRKEGIRISRGGGHTFESVRAVDCGRDGVTTYDSPGQWRNCLMINNGQRGFVATGSKTNDLSFCTMAGNASSQTFARHSTVEIHNSIVVADAPGTACIDFQDPDTVYRGDDNCLYASEDAHVGIYREGADVARYTQLESWQAESGRDGRSFSLDPLFADPEDGDYHLQSVTGRLGVSGIWTNDPLHSPCIDLADPAEPWGGETDPNGSRANLGAYGGTAAASRSRTAPWLLALALNSGGELEGSIDLRWAAGNVDPAAAVQIGYSPDAGDSWTVVASGIPAGDGFYPWDTATVVNSPTALWGVVLESDPAVRDACDEVFFLHGIVPTAYYVNDRSALNDVYCTAIGSATHPGTSPSQPALSIGQILDAFPIQPGDTIYVDTGLYTLAEDLVIPESVSGVPGAPIVIQGSTHQAPEGTIIDRMTQADHSHGIRLDRTRHLELHDLTVVNGEDSISIENTEGCALLNVHVQGAARYGIYVGGSDPANLVGVRASLCRAGARLSGATVSHSLFTSNETDGIAVEGDADLYHCTVAMNGYDAVDLARGHLHVENSILDCSSGGNYCILQDVAATYSGDYNAFFATTLHSAFRRAGDRLEFEAWRRAANQDAHSFFLDPRFANVQAGDFHLRSRTGRRLADGSWTTDTDHSPCIDTGDPAWPASAESTPNGNRVNMGAYGGTEEASRGLTVPWLLATSMNSGGNHSGTAGLRWTGGSLDPSAPVSVETSRDGGATWLPVAAALRFDEESLPWDTVSVGPWPAVLWRVVLDADPGVADESERVFLIRNGAVFDFYVNDGSLSGDAYCTAPGATGQLGVLPAAPARSAAAVLETYDLEPGDRLLIDTGTYRDAAGIVLEFPHEGDESAYVTIQGSPYNGGHGTAFAPPNDGTTAAVIRDTHYVCLRDFTLTGAGTGVYINAAGHCLLQNLRIKGCAGDAVFVNAASGHHLERLYLDRNGDNGIRSYRSRNNVLSNSIVWRNGASALLLVSNDEWDVLNCTIVDNGNNEIRVAYDDGVLRLLNSILVADGPGDECVSRARRSILTSNYNNYWLRNGAKVVDGQTLPEWQSKYLRDRYSLSLDPLFVDEARGDFHLRSSAVDGTFVSATDSWTAFPCQDSPCIDTADRALSFDNEPPWNGERRNMGAFGDTPEASRSIDTDGDGLSDTSELHAWGCSPYHEESDGDTLPDAMEALTLGTHPGKADTDGDRLRDDHELRAGTDPLDDASVLRVTSCFRPGDHRFEITWQSVQDHAYRILAGTSPVGPWETVAGDITATPPLNTESIVAPEAAQGFFIVADEEGFGGP